MTTRTFIAIIAFCVGFNAGVAFGRYGLQHWHVSESCRLLFAEAFSCKP